MTSRVSKGALLVMFSRVLTAVVMAVLAYAVAVAFDFAPGPLRSSAAMSCEISERLAERDARLGAYEGDDRIRAVVYRLEGDESDNRAQTKLINVIRDEHGGVMMVLPSCRLLPATAVNARSQESQHGTIETWLAARAADVAIFGQYDDGDDLYKLSFSLGRVEESETQIVAIEQFTVGPDFLDTAANAIAGSILVQAKEQDTDGNQFISDELEDVALKLERVIGAVHEQFDEKTALNLRTAYRSIIFDLGQGSSGTGWLEKIIAFERQEREAGRGALSNDLRERGDSLNWLGVAQIELASRTNGDRELVLSGIESLEASLEYRTRESFPAAWASTHNNIGVAYQALANYNGQLTDYKTALHHFGLALEVRTQEDYPGHWVSTQINIAQSYTSMGRLYNLSAFEQRNDGQESIAQDSRSQGSKALGDALEIYSLLTNVVDPVYSPAIWVTVQLGWADVYVEISSSDGTLRNVDGSLEKSIAILKGVLDFITQDEAPREWRFAQSSLASAYRGMAYISDRNDQLSDEKRLEMTLDYLLLSEKSYRAVYGQISDSNLTDWLAVTTYNLASVIEFKAQLTSELSDWQEAFMFFDESARYYDQTEGGSIDAADARQRANQVTVYIEALQQGTIAEAAN
ncbi:MAG: hypothetical protein AAFR65_00735 [Pseudomonadota bacterium]